METLFFKVADILFTIQGKSADELKKLLPSYAPFNIAATDAKPALSLTVEDGAIDTSAVGEELGQFDCGGSNHGIYRTEQGYKIIISTVEGNVASAMLTNAMMIAFAFAAAYYDTILMHASVTMNEGRGYLFLGKSGTGKSTHSKLWMKHIAGSDLLNDDNPAVRFTPQGAIVYGTPWSGKTPCYRNLQVPIGAYVRLEQHPENIICRETPLQAFASILSSCSTMMWDKPSYQHITRTVEKVVTHVPVFYLKCRADAEAAQLSHDTITA